MIIKVTTVFIKSLKENKNKKGLEKVLSKIISNFDEKFELNGRQQIQSGYTNWQARKIDCTSQYGAYRLIFTKREDNRMVCDFYFKNENQNEGDNIKYIKALLEKCNDETYYSELENIEKYIEILDID